MLMEWSKNQLQQFQQFCNSIQNSNSQVEAQKWIPFNKKGNKIHIKKENEGKFTDYCNGKVTEECIQKGKNSPDSKIRKMATFAANARKWNHNKKN